MGGGSLGFAGSIASFCMALLKAYCEERQKAMAKWIFGFLVSREDKPQYITHLLLNLPELRLFSTVHLAVDNENVWQASNVARLHLQWQKNMFTMQNRVESHRKHVEYWYELLLRRSEKQSELTVGWYFSQFSHHAWVLCSRQMLFFKISAKSHSFIVLSDEK